MFYLLSARFSEKTEGEYNTNSQIGWSRCFHSQSADNIPNLHSYKTKHKQTCLYLMHLPQIVCKSKRLAWAMETNGSSVQGLLIVTTAHYSNTPIVREPLKRPTRCSSNWLRFIAWLGYTVDYMIRVRKKRQDQSQSDWGRVFVEYCWKNYCRKSN